MNLRICLFALFGAAPLLQAAAPVSFSRDILPILSDKCLSCHGPDESTRKAGLRLDLRDTAVRPNKEGVSAISPKAPETSELIKRITSTDSEEVMPTPKSHKAPLTAQQIDLFRRWIQEGAEWGRHWAFQSPSRPPVPPDAQHPVDAFVRAALKKEGLAAAPQAEPHTLLRRVSFDLTGLPPTLDELKRFQTASTASVWASTVERLLASPRFGEKLAMWWLDTARYSDTDGFQSDSTRSNWPWRDWVVDSFNANKPFDQFTVEQFAGDLLPDATPEQRLATCFHRNHMTNGEGGRDPEESRVDYVIDRVNTTGTAFLGLTLGCTQCHSHKFDPITHAEYYSLSAFFNSIDETGAAGTGAKPFQEYKSAHGPGALANAESLVEFWKQEEGSVRSAAMDSFEQELPSLFQRSSKSFKEWKPVIPTRLESAEGTVLTHEENGSVSASGPDPNQDDYRFFTRIPVAKLTGIKLEVLPKSEHTGGGLSRGKSGEFILTDLKVQVRQAGKAEVRDITIKSAVADFSADKKANGGYGDIKDTLDDDPRNGWSTKGAPQTEAHTAVFALADPLELEHDEELVVELRQRSTLGDANIGCFRLLATDEPGETIRSLKQGALQELADAHLGDPSQIGAPLRKRLLERFLEEYPPHIKVKSALAKATEQRNEAKSAASALKVMVLEERKEPRETFVLLRGVWDKHGDKVEHGVPAAIADWPEGEPKNRLGLARWIVSKNNPLTARVIVNQLWQQMFGAGLVRTPEDFGLQGEAPTHPELLDWLAVEFMESGWDVKRMLRLIATSETYRQSSTVTPALLSKDPHNRLLARGTRFRLPAWMLRDAALVYSGLLNPDAGGPPARPYQPAGVWEELFMGRFKYEPSLGATQYRRTLYAFWRRSIAPTFLFDSAQRRVCEVRANRTNTPLHALTLLNDETCREAARVLAAGAVGHTSTPEARLDWLARSILSRSPKASEVPPLMRLVQQAQAHYAAKPDDARKVLSSGQAPAPPAEMQSQVAAYAMAASLLMNLDEAISHE